MKRNVLRPKSQKPRSKPVTLTVGIVCKDAIVMAADSRTTYQSHVDDLARKLRTVEFDGGSSLVCWAGYIAFAVDTVDIFQRKVERFKPVHFRDLAEKAKEVIDEVKSREMTPYRAASFSVEGVENYLRDNRQFNLLLAYYFREEPYLYTLGFPAGHIQREQAHFAAEGQNASLATYLLKQYTQPKMDRESATAVAVYVIEAIKEHDGTVGGPTKVAILRRPKPLPGPRAVLPSKLGGSDCIGFPDYSTQAQLLTDADVLKISKKLRQ